MKLQLLLKELKRRNVIKTAGAYGVVAWLLIQVVVTIKAPLHLPDWIDTAVIIAVLIGFPIALIIAWVFELTPEGLQKTDEIAENESESLAKSTGKKLNRIIIGSLSLVIVLLITERVFLAGDFFEEVEPSIAVLPFVNMSADPDNKYFSNGLSEELRSRLSKLPTLNVAGRGSSSLFEGKNIEYQAIGEKLGVNHILEGTVRKEGDQLRITASLIRISDNQELWSEIYDRKYENIFSIQEELSSSVINQLKFELSIEQLESINDRNTNNVQAYDAWLRATELRGLGSSLKIDSAIYYFEEAIRLDDQFAEAYADLAGCYSDKVMFDQLEYQEAEPIVRKYIEKALLIDANEATIYFELAHLHSNNFEYFSKDSLYLYQAKEALLKANELAPRRAFILTGLAIVSADLGEKEKMYDYSLQAYEIDPRPGLGANIAIRLAYQFNMPDTALVIMNELLQKYPIDEFPNSVGLLYQMAGVDKAANRIGEGFISSYKYYQAVGKDNRVVSDLFFLSLLLDLPDLARLFLNDLKSNETNSYKYYYRDNLERLGQFDELERWAEKELKEDYGEKLNKRLALIKMYQFFQKEEYESGEMLLRRELEGGDNPYMNSVRIKRNLGLFLYAQGKKDEADSLVETTFPSNAPPFLQQFKLNTSDSIMSIFDKTYFADRKGSKIFILESGILNMHFHYFDELGLFDSIREDRNNMRSKVISYLKEIGDWKPEWTVNDQVLFSRRPVHLDKLKKLSLKQK